MAQVPPPAFVEGAARNDLPPLYHEGDRELKEKVSLNDASADVVAADAYYDPRSEWLFQ